MEMRDVRSRISGLKVTRAAEVSFNRPSLLLWCLRSCNKVSSPFLLVLVVMMTVKECEGGRVSRNSSTRRRQMANPSPL